MKIKYDKPFGTLETIEVIVNMDIPVFYFAKNENEKIYLVYLYAEYGEKGEFEEVVIIPYSEEKFELVKRGKVSLLDSIVNISNVYFITDYFNRMDWKPINPEILDQDKLPAKNVYYCNGHLEVREELVLSETIKDVVKIKSFYADGITTFYNEYESKEMEIINVNIKPIIWNGFENLLDNITEDDYYLRNRNKLFGIRDSIGFDDNLKVNVKETFSPISLMKKGKKSKDFDSILEYQLCAL